MITQAALLCAGVLLPSALAQTCFNAQNFDQYDDNHVYSRADIEKDWAKSRGPYKMVAGDTGVGGQPLTIIEDGTIRATFPEGVHLDCSTSKIQGYDTGFTWYSVHPKAVDEASMSYRVKFSEGFDWTMGGKLPGLCGGDESISGAPCPVGCTEVGRDRGFSTRLMWKKDGALVTYAYYPDKPSSIRCGEDWRWGKKAEAGKWYDIKMWVKLNSGDNADGEYKAWLDGEEVLHRTGIRFRYSSNMKITRTYITTYVGGSKVEEFAPHQDQYIWFDDFESWEGGDDSPCSLSPSSENLIDSSAESATVTFRDPGTSDSSEQSRKTTQGAPLELDGYELYDGAAGWDIWADHFSRTAPPRGELNDKLKFCADLCDKEAPKCVAFTLARDTCYLKSKNDGSIQYIGDSKGGWRWLYIQKSRDLGDLMRLSADR